MVTFDKTPDETGVNVGDFETGRKLRLTVKTVIGSMLVIMTTLSGIRLTVKTVIGNMLVIMTTLSGIRLMIKTLLVTWIRLRLRLTVKAVTRKLEFLK
jgi:hypothetical protein